MTGLFWAVTAAALALDVGSKLWAVHSLGQRVTVLPGVSAGTTAWRWACSAGTGWPICCCR